MEEEDAEYGVKRCMTAPIPSTYVAVAAAPSKKPARHFCNVCSYFGMYVCVFDTGTRNSLFHCTTAMTCPPFFSDTHAYDVVCNFVALR